MKQQAGVGGQNQFFYIEKIGNSNYSRLVPFADTTKTVAVSGTGYSENLGLTVVDKASNHKPQEFYFKELEGGLIPNAGEYGYKYEICSRSTGHYRKIYAPSTTAGVQLLQGRPTNNDRAQWILHQVQLPFTGTYGQEGGSVTPVDKYVYADFTGLSVNDTGLVDSTTLYDCTVTMEGEQTALNISPLAYLPYIPVRLAIINFTSLPSGLLGLCTPYKKVQGTYITADPNEDWSWCEITLDMAQIKQESSYQALTTDPERRSFIKGIMLHELGHTCKLSHTFSRWAQGTSPHQVESAAPFSNSIMTIWHFAHNTTPTFKWIDRYRVDQKWASLV